MQQGQVFAKGNGRGDATNWAYRYRLGGSDSDELKALADGLGRRLGPLVLFAAATGLRPSEWLALELRDIDRQTRVVDVRRAYRNGRIKCPKTDASTRAVPLQSIAPRRSTRSRGATGRRSYSRPRAAAISTCTTSATATGSPPSASSGSTRSEGSTSSDIPPLRSRLAPASRASTSPATWAPACP